MLFMYQMDHGHPGDFQMALGSVLLFVVNEPAINCIEQEQMIA